MTTNFELDILRQLREEAGITQEEMARLCGLHGQQRRQTAGAWERGEIIPSRARRTKFIGYLWDSLHLRDDPNRFESTWDILIDAWDWDAISDAEWASFTRATRPPKAPAPEIDRVEIDRAEIDQKLEALVTRLNLLQSAVVPVQSDIDEVQRAPTHANITATITAPINAPLNYPLDQLAEVAPLPPGSRMPLARNPLFVGRGGELLALAAAFHPARGQQDGPQIAAISQVAPTGVQNNNIAPPGAQNNQLATAAAAGLGGIGKTQLASEFVHRYGHFFAGGVFWLSFDNAESIASEIATCGGAGALELRPDFATRSLDEQVRLVQAAWQQPIPRLLVFDNCEEPSLLSQWRPTSGGCRILVTSRCLEWDLALGVQLHALDLLPREESLKLLQMHKLNATPDVLNAIAAELGDLPLALHLAGSYLHRYRRVLTAEEYLAYLRDPALLSHPSLQNAGASPTGHVQHVARTFAISYEQLDPTHELDARARQILVHMALLAPGESVPYDLMAQTLDSDASDPQPPITSALSFKSPQAIGRLMQMEEAIVRLLELGLIDAPENAPENAHQDANLRVHRLVASFVRESAPQQCQQAQPRIERAVQQRLDAYRRSIRPLPLLPIQTHLRHVTESALARQEADGVLLCDAFARYLLGQGDFAAAQRLCERGLAIRQRTLGARHRQTAISHHLLGILLQESNQSDEARAHLNRALEIRLHHLGENHFEVADTLVNLAEVSWNEQRIGDAITILERALRICDEAVEEDDPLVAEVTMMLGQCMLDGGYEAKQARFYMEEALRIRRQKLGTDHPYTARALTNLGFLLNQTGQLEEAGPYYEEGLAIRQRILGDKHGDTANSLYCMGKLRRMQGRWQEAQDYLVEALSFYLETQDEEYVPTASCFNELGAATSGAGDFARARVYLERALTVRQKIYHADHPYLADTLFHLALVDLAQGEHARAEARLRHVLAVRRLLRDPENLRVAETLCALAQVAEARADRDQARSLYAQSVALYQRHLGNNHPDTAKVAALLEANS